MMIGICFNFLNTLPLGDGSICHIRKYLHWKKLFHFAMLCRTVENTGRWVMQKSYDRQGWSQMHWGNTEAWRIVTGIFYRYAEDMLRIATADRDGARCTEETLRHVGLCLGYPTDLLRICWGCVDNFHPWECWPYLRSTLSRIWALPRLEADAGRSYTDIERCTTVLLVLGPDAAGWTTIFYCTNRAVSGGLSVSNVNGP